MPDLATHLLVTHLARRGREMVKNQTLPEAEAVLFYLGGCLPDFLSRAPGMLVSAPWARRVVEVLHEPVPTVLVAYVLAMLLPEAGRRRYFLWITMGVGLHYSLDILQKVYGDGGQKWLFPFSWKSIQLGLFWPDQAVLFILPLLVVTGVVELRLIQARRAGIKDKSAKG